MGSFSRVTFCFLIAVLTASVRGEPWTQAERASIASLGPWPMEWTGDPSNRFSQNPSAIELGEQLFFDRRLSHNNVLACGDCHRPNAQFADGIALNRGLKPLERHTPSLFNVRNNRWFGWGGEHDSLWSQSIRPVLNDAEMKGNALAVQRLVENDSNYRAAFQSLTQQSIEDFSETDILILVGKFLAAYQETLATPRTRFDDYRDAITTNTDAKVTLTEQELKGLKIFIGEGNCILCHGGPNFTFGEFGDIGVPFFTETGVDKGRYAGIQKLQSDPFTLLSDFNDDETKSTATRTQFVTLLHRNWGEFKVPSLRNVSNTAPYMHNGSLETLDDVINFYSELNEERLHADGEKILKPLNLSVEEKAALKALLSVL